jgi:hypothetical protein
VVIGWITKLALIVKSRPMKQRDMGFVFYILITTTLAILMPQPLRADETYYGLIVHGGGTTHTSYEAGILRVAFRHSSHPAGDSLSYESQVPRGTAAWPDRLMSPQEPSVLLQKMPQPMP